MLQNKINDYILLIPFIFVVILYIIFISVIYSILLLGMFILNIKDFLIKQHIFCK